MMRTTTRGGTCIEGKKTDLHGPSSNTTSRNKGIEFAHPRRVDLDHRSGSKATRAHLPNLLLALNLLRPQKWIGQFVQRIPIACIQVGR